MYYPTLKITIINIIPYPIEFEDPNSFEKRVSFLSILYKNLDIDEKGLESIIPIEVLYIPITPSMEVQFSDTAAFILTQNNQYDLAYGRILSVELLYETDKKIPPQVDSIYGELKKRVGIILDKSVSFIDKEEFSEEEIKAIEKQVTYLAFNKQSELKKHQMSLR